MSKPKLTEQDYQRAAQELGCDVAAIKAVDEVEAAGNGFLDDGRPKILFERHKFRKFTGARFDREHPDLSNAKAGGYGPAGAHQWRRFSRAFALDAKAAMKSCSWGKYQIMGFNFAAAGFKTLDAFVDAMKVSEGAQLDAFVNLVKSFALDDELRNHDWRRFAAGYNGANYRINKYDTKLAAAHKKHARSAGVTVTTVGSSVIDDIEIEHDEDVHVTEVTDDKVDEPVAAKVDETPPTAPVQVPPAAKPPIDPTAVVEVQKTQVKEEPAIMGGLRTHWAAAMGFVTSAGAGAIAFLKGLPAPAIYGFFAFATIIVVAYIVQRAMMRNKAENRQLERERMAHELTLAQMKTASDPNAYTVAVTT